MFNNPYPYQLINERGTGIENPHRITSYRFTAKHRTYFVTIEQYSIGIVAVKYCDIKGKGGKRAYEKIFNDGDGFRVITTCMRIMWDWWQKNPITNFAFYAVPRNIPQKESKIRLNIYRYGMINLFKRKDFKHYQDRENSIYLMLHKKQTAPEKILKELEKYLLDNHGVIFTPVLFRVSSSKKKRKT